MEINAKVQGSIDYNAGCSDSENPYPAETYYYFEWLKGWQEACEKDFKDADECEDFI